MPQPSTLPIQPVCMHVELLAEEPFLKHKLMAAAAHKEQEQKTRMLTVIDNIRALWGQCAQMPAVASDAALILVAQTVLEAMNTMRSAH